MPPEYQHPVLVQRAKLAPGKCAVTGDIDGPFVDCGIKYENRNHWTRLYLHAPWVEQIARDLLKMVPRSEFQKVEAELAGMKDEIEELRAMNAAVEEFEIAKSKLEAVAS